VYINIYKDIHIWSAGARRRGLGGARGAQGPSAKCIYIYIYIYIGLTLLCSRREFLDSKGKQGPAHAPVLVSG